ncbi:MAG TPA: DbpA RNA binding domain-containing protein [Gemmatimonadaceae bacterium]|jgi:ATP-dependent RNA helicase DeaD|nr:DbpA RNA binding domain-containing protein [Gemmatimonadaceae bacterium]
MSSVDRDPASHAVSRGQNAVIVLPHDWASIAEFLAPLVERIDADGSDLQLLVATGDADAAAAVIAAAVRLIGDRPIRVLAATSTARASRLARLRTPQLIAATPTTLVELIRASAIKLADLRAICIAWADEVVARDESASLETLMAEVPKTAARTIVASIVTPAVDELVERYARRARREAAQVPASNEPIALEYVLVSPAARSTTLRRLLDELDPESATVFAREAESRASVGNQLRSLGYAGDGDVRCAVAAAPGTALTVLYDLPATHEELREAVAGAARRIAIIQPRQLESLRALALNGVLKPHRLPETAAASRARDASVLAQLRATLEAGTVSRELLSLEPLLDEYDGVEVAAAALKLLEHERLAERARVAAQTRAPQGEGSAVAARAPTGPMVSLFASVGERDGIRPADLVGMITSKAGVAGSDVGRIDIRDSHSTIEVASELADQIIDRASGTILKGRRALLKRDERPARREDRPFRREGAPRREGGGPRREGAPRRDGGGRDERRPREARGGFRARDRDDDRPRRGRDDDDRPRRGPRGPRPTPRA